MRLHSNQCGKDQYICQLQPTECVSLFVGLFYIFGHGNIFGPHRKITLFYYVDNIVDMGSNFLILEKGGRDGWGEEI